MYYTCIALFCNILCKLDVLLYDKNINKVYFALYMSACCFQYTPSAFLWRETHHRSIYWLLQMDQMIQNASDFHFITVTSAQILYGFLNSPHLHFIYPTTLKWHTFISAKKKIFVHTSVSTYFAKLSCDCIFCNSALRLVFFVRPDKLFKRPFCRLLPPPCFSDRMTD